MYSQDDDYDSSEFYATQATQQQQQQQHFIAVQTPAEILSRIIFEAAHTASPDVSRRLLDSGHQLSLQLTAALANSLLLGGGGRNNNHSSSSISALPPLTHKQVCHAAALSSPQQAIESPVRDALLRQLATTIKRASPEEVNSVGRLAKRISDAFLLECSRAVPDAVHTGMFRGLLGPNGNSSSSSNNNSATPDRRRDRDHHHHHPTSFGLNRAVSLGCARLDQMCSPRHRGLLRGQVHELYGEAGCGKSTWAAQLMLHTLRTAKMASAMAITVAGGNDDDGDEDGDHTQKPALSFNSGSGGNAGGNNNNNNSDGDGDGISVVLLSAEPVSMQRIEQIARAEWTSLQASSSTSASSSSHTNGIFDYSSGWRSLLKGFLIVELRHVEHFEESVRMLLRDFDRGSNTNNQQQQQQRQDVPLVVLDSVAALVEKSMGTSSSSSSSTAAANKPNSAVTSSFFDDRPTDPKEKAECVERVGTALRQMAWTLNSAVVVVNQARWSGPESERAAASLGSTGASKAAFSMLSLSGGGGGIMSSSSGGGGNVQPALGYQWSTFISGCSVELSRPPRGGNTPASRRRANLVRSSTSGPFGPVEFDLVAGGLSDKIVD